jgi:ABC-2 type transport system ATP-binding protein
MPQTVTAVPGLTVSEQVAYAGWLGGLKESVAQARATETVVQVGLEAERDQQSSVLSGGQLRRVGLAEALVLHADHLLLDEPMAGLDPAQRGNFRSILMSLPPCGLVVSTHQTDDVAEVFERVTVLADGGIRFDGSVAQFEALAPAAAVGGRSSSVVDRAFATFVAGGRH